MELSRNFVIYLPYVMVKYTLHWMVIAFKDSGDVIHNGVSSTYLMIAIYKGTPFLYSFLVYLHNTCYMAGWVMDIRCIL